MRRKIIIIKKGTNSHWTIQTARPISKRVLESTIEKKIDHYKIGNRTFTVGGADYRWEYVLDKPIEKGDWVIRVSENHMGYEQGDVTKIRDIAHTSLQFENDKNSREIGYDATFHVVIDHESYYKDEDAGEDEPLIKIEKKQIKLFGEDE